MTPQRVTLITLGVADLARARGAEPKSAWFFYTTCPKCAKAYGKNYVVGIAEL
mgnify:CR=1 FL=1